MELLRPSVLALVVVIGLAVTNGQGNPSFDYTPSKLRELSINLLKELSRTSEGNIVYSPLSLVTALGMVELGAQQQTKEELGRFLGLDKPSLSRFHDIVRSIKGDASLTSSNAAFVNKGFSVKQDYKNTLQNVFLATEQTLDFGNNVKAAQMINAWVEENTKGKITDLITPDFINADMKMLLTNAIYFKGQWRYSFKTDKTRSGTFTTDKGTKVSVPMMSQDEKFRYQYVSRLNASALEMPYSNNRFSMLILLPHQGNVGQFIQHLTQEDLVEILNTMMDIELVVTLPRFKVGNKRKLEAPLKQLGLNSIFTPEGDLRGIAEDNLYVSDIVHEAKIEVDEQGTIGSAATGVGVVAISLPPSFTANRPFVFVVMDRHYEVPIFIGKITDPSEE